MKHVIIGTAGHVDHGKTQLIKALTGIDTDRLLEEKKRGITIELGFAHIDWADGTQAGIVDVPGHEKFIKNMLAGVGGIDLAMLVVAADEGFMPQTEEHLDILTLSAIQDGLIVITKADLVDPEWLEMMKEEVREKVAGTFLADKPILTVSAYTGEGIPALKEKLYDLVQQAGEKNLRVPFRLPIDRVFSVDGFGTVVTGTLIEGAITEENAVQLVPSGLETRVRNLQVYGKSVKTAFAGQRVAVNLAGIKKTDIQRGEALVSPGTVRVSHMLDVKLQNLRNSRRNIENGTQVHLYHGGSALMAKVILLDREILQPGESCYAQLRMKDEIATKNGDRFVVRFYSPLETIGGGVILNDMPEKHRRNDPTVLEALRVKESGNSGDRIAQIVAEFGKTLPNAEKLAVKVGVDQETLAVELQDIINQGKILEPVPGRYIAASEMDAIWGECGTLLKTYHVKNPLHAGMKEAELRQKLFKSTDRSVADALLSELCRETLIKRIADCYALENFEIRFTKKQTAIKNKLLHLYKTAGVEPPTIDEAQAGFALQERADLKQVIDSVISNEDLILLAPQLCCHRDIYNSVCNLLKEHFQMQPTITLAEMRDKLGTSRKYALAFLEYWDRKQITKKEGDFRSKGRMFDRYV